MDRAGKFYSLIGLHFKRHSHGTGPEHLTSEVDELVFEIYPATEKSKSTAGTRLGFAVDSLDQLLPQLVEAGARVLTAPCDSEWGRRAVIKDLDDHTVELVAAATKVGQAGG